MHHRKLIEAVASGGARQFSCSWCTPVCLLALWPFSPTVLAQESVNPIEVCSKVTDRDARLDCFDHAAALRNHVAPVAPAGTSKPPTPTDTRGVTPAPNGPADDITGLDAKQISARRKAEGRPPQVVKPIVATLARLDQQPTGHCYFELDNGQVWAATACEPAQFPALHETVRIRPGVFGAFFLKTREGSSIKVYRLR